MMPAEATLLLRQLTRVAGLFCLPLALAACGIELPGAGPPEHRSHPVIERFAISGSEAPLIVAEPSTLTLEVTVASGPPLEQVAIYANQSLLHTFTSPPFRHDWQITADDNGFYSFRIEALDDGGNLAVANYRHRLGINIH